MSDFSVSSVTMFPALSFMSGSYGSRDRSSGLFLAHLASFHSLAGSLVASETIAFHPIISAFLDCVWLKFCIISRALLS